MCREAERKKEISRKGAKRQRSKWRDVNGEKQEATGKWAIGKRQKPEKQPESKLPKLIKQQATEKRNNLTGRLSNKKSKILGSIQFTLVFN